MAAIYKGFSNLFNFGDPEDAGQGEAEGDDVEASDSYAERWGWIANVDAVSETCRCSWDDVWSMNVIEFLNILCYRRDRAEKQKAELEIWKKNH